MHGILLLDKPLGLSSAAAVARTKRLFAARKAGHTGSLDPLASGMLPICLGEATKFGALMLEADKTYRLTLRLGERTPSADLESTVIERRELPPLTARDLERALADFPRAYAQVPPMHSAIKQDGKPLYVYARAGETRERAARSIVIHDMQLIEWLSPDLTFDVRCTKGAYMRVLAEDLALRLATIGHLVGLRRLGVAPFAHSPQWTFEALEAPVAGRARSAAAAGRCGTRRLAAARSAGRGYRGGSPRPQRRGGRRMHRKRAYLCAGARFRGLGRGRGVRAADAAAAHFRGHESSLRAGRATRTMRASLKGHKLLIEV